MIIAIVLLGSSVVLGAGKGTIEGTLYDQEANVPVESANIILHSGTDSTAITGTISDENGQFRLTDLALQPYYLVVQYIGYEMLTVPNINLEAGHTTINLGQLKLRQEAIEGEGIVVEGQKPAVQFRADRKIIDASQIATAEGGFAIDLLKYIPSIEVDFDDNVTLRGSSNFIVQINGRPTVLDPQEALQQIPASSIKYIEVITNPSAKYSAEGSAGIINIILVDDNLSGSSAMLRTNAGLNDKYGAHGTYTYSHNQLSFNVGGSYNRHMFSGTRSQQQTTYLGDVTNHLNTSGDTQRGFKGGDGNLGLHYQASDNDLFTVGFRYGNRGFLQNSMMSSTTWSNNTPRLDYTDISKSDNSQTFYSGSFSFDHKFRKEGHEISGDLYYSNNDGNGESLSETTNDQSELTSGKKTAQSGPSYRTRAKIDYTLPLGGQQKIEAGYQVNISGSDELIQQFQYDLLANEYQLQPKYSYGTNSYRNEQSLYSMYSNSWNKLNYILGVRNEYTYRDITHPDTSASFRLNRWEFFPSIHTSYAINNMQEVMLSYSRRIDRPHDRDLEPFQVWEDANNIRTGNPSLKPEYIDSWELGFQTPLGKNYLNLDLYYQNQTNVIEHIRSAYKENVTLTTPVNVGISKSLGTELSYRFNPLSFWELSLSSNLRKYQITGELDGQSFARDNFNWNVRANQSFTIKEAWRLQVSSRYRSSSVTAQGSNGGSFSTDLSLRRDLFGKKLSANLQVRDLFGTSQRESTTTTQNMTVNSTTTRESPMVMLSLRLNLGGFSSSSSDRRGGFGGAHPH